MSLAAFCIFLIKSSYNWGLFATLTSGNISAISDLNNMLSSNVNFEVVFNSSACTATEHSSERDLKPVEAFKIVPQNPITVFKARRPQS